jgi:hypothetical protein
MRVLLDATVQNCRPGRLLSLEAQQNANPYPRSVVIVAGYYQFPIMPSDAVLMDPRTVKFMWRFGVFSQLPKVLNGLRHHPGTIQLS